MNLGKILFNFIFAIISFQAASIDDSSITGFLPNEVGAQPVSRGYSGQRPRIEINDAESLVVLIYLHGTDSPKKYQDCSQKYSGVPDVLLNLNRPDVVIFYLCSTAVETFSLIPGSYIFNRLDEVEVILDELSAAGVTPSQIVIAGHSAGGWVALMSFYHFPARFEGAITFSPAFSGRKDNAPFWWRKVARPFQIKRMLGVDKMNALVFAYHDDPFEDPKDLFFLIEKFASGVKLVGYGCNNTHPHYIAFNDCKIADESPRMA